MLKVDGCGGRLLRLGTDNFQCFLSLFRRKTTYACSDEDVKFRDDPVETCCKLFAGKATAA